jgi:hypothetical protein
VHKHAIIFYLSSTGPTGRSSTPRRLDSITAASGILDRRLEPVVGLAEGETRWRVMATEGVAYSNFKQPIRIIIASASEAIHRATKKEWIASLALAMTALHTSAFSRRLVRPSRAAVIRPERGRRECRAPNAPAASRAKVKSTRV